MTGAVIDQQRIFVVCPAGTVTGGPELLHQVVHALRAMGREAYLVYEPMGQTWETPEPYRRYGCPVATAIPDEPDCAVVVPEVIPGVLYRFGRARHVIWWLSVDYYRGGRDSADAVVRWLRRLVYREIPDPLNTVHLFQSVFAREFVRRRFNAGGMMLSDYIAPDFMEPAAPRPRRDAVAFNPKKGMRFTRRLMRAHPDIEFVPLQGMSRAQMRDTLDGCKAYMDFGTHPGKDRIPREAAMRGAVVIVGRRGAAAGPDVALPEEYKIPAGREAVDLAAARLRGIFADYERHRRAQEPYRAAIAGEPAEFHLQLERVFGRTPGGAVSGVLPAEPAAIR